MREQFVDRIPTAQVVPSEVVDSKSGDIGGALEHGVIHGNVLAKREGLLQHLRESAVHERRQAGQKRGGLGLKFAQRVQQHRSLPKEHPRVPKEVSGFDISYAVFCLKKKK